MFSSVTALEFSSFMTEVSISVPNLYALKISFSGGIKKSH